MAGQTDKSGLGSETSSRFSAVPGGTPGLWSLGLKTGLTPQHLAPVHTGTHHKLEVNPFEASYAHAGDVPRQVGEVALEQLKRPRIDHLQMAGAGPQKDSSSSSDSRSSNESRAMSATTYDTPPSDEPLSPVATKSMAGTPMLSLDAISHVVPTQSGMQNMGSGIDANAYAEHLARYVQAQAVHATRTSAPLAGHSTSRPPAAFGSSPEQESMAHFADDDVSVGSPEHHDDDHPLAANLPAALASVQPAAAQQPRKKATSAKTTPTTKRGKVGRPRSVKEEEVDESITPEEAKRRDFLERNRQAACKSRQKRKAWQANLEAEAHRLTENNGQLQALVANLREEIAGLRATVAGHAANGCQAARLALQAARPGDVPMAAFVVPSPTVAMHTPMMSQHGNSGDIYVGPPAAAMDSAMSYHHPSAIEVQRTPSGHELTPSNYMGAGATYFDAVAAAGLSTQQHAGRSSDVDLSAYLA